MTIEIGDVFTRLTVIAKAEDRISPSGKVRKYWLCKCSCGRNKMVEVRSDGLTGGGTQSCGCLRDESAAVTRASLPPPTGRPLPNLVGNVYGKLTVVKKGEPTETPKGRKLPRWECVCECGTKPLLYHERLIKGEYISCGCVSKKAYDCGFKTATEEFIAKASEVHAGKYDYSLVEYEHSQINVKIVCKVHGIFEQQPSNHLMGNGCRACSKEARTGNLESFISKSETLHSFAYDYSKVKFVSPTKCVTITCNKHGDFEQKPKNHLVGMGCPTCNSETTNNRRKAEFIQRSIEKHGDRYDYSKVIYEHSRTPVKIICPVHGEFLQTFSIHMTGSKCPKCAWEERALKQHWDYLERCKLDDKLANSDAVLYLLKLDRGCESFLKVGISSSFIKRLSRYREEGLTFEVLAVVNTKAIKAALLERDALKYIIGGNLRYIPNNLFAGWTECATLESKDQLLELFKGYINNE